MTRVANSDEPPAEKKGRVTPVVGTSPTATAMLRNAWRQMAAVTPKATKYENRSSARKAMERLGQSLAAVLLLVCPGGPGHLGRAPASPDLARRIP